MITTLPEPFLEVVHFYMLAAQALANTASEQPPEVAGKDPAVILNAVMGGIQEFWETLPQEQKEEYLIRTAEKLGELSGAISVTHTIIEG